MQLTKADVQAIRSHIASARFIHWRRFAAEWALPIDVLKRLAGHFVPTNPTGEQSQ